MKTVVVRYQTYTVAGIFLFVFCAAMGFLKYKLNADGAWYRLILLGAFLALIFCGLGTQKVIFSERGIESKFLWWSSLETWEQVIQAGITNVADHGDWGLYLLLTFTGGKPKTRTMGFSDWKSCNGGKCEYVPVSSELRELVIQCYGMLDFDLSNGHSEQSKVID